jgi:hypothetical protein
MIGKQQGMTIRQVAGVLAWASSPVFWENGAHFAKKF